MAMQFINSFFQKQLAKPLTSVVIPYCQGHYFKEPKYEPKDDPNYKTIPSRNHYKQKHRNQKFRLERHNKVMKIDLPDFNEKSETEMTPGEIREKMKEKGLQPFRPWSERTIFIGSTASIFDAYVPPEGDGKLSFASKEGAKQKFEFVEKKGKSWMALRKIRQFDEDFDPKVFVEEAQQIYIDTNKALMDFDDNDDSEVLHNLVTEKAFPIITHQIKSLTIRWQFHGSLEPPRVVYVRCTDILTKENIFAQVTVRFHTKQTLAVYDRFGRLQHGSEVVARDVLEYVVFEKHIANTYGKWRIHDKIVPDWMPPQSPIRRTYKLENEEINISDTDSQATKDAAAPSV